jgi:predicted alpha/beta hydrolase
VPVEDHRVPVKRSPEAALRQVLHRQDGPTLVVGHSYGGQIMTALGADAPNAVGLVYIAAFGLDEGESLGAIELASSHVAMVSHPDEVAQFVETAAMAVTSGR